MRFLLRLLILSLLFFTPIVFTTNTNELFEFPKMFFVYIFGTAAFGVFLIERIASGKKIRIPPLSILFYLLAFVISVVGSSHMYTSIWGYYTRFNGGLVSILVFFGIYFVVSNAFNRLEKEELIQLMLLPIVPLGLYGISQHFGFGLVEWKANPEIRVFSTFGQPNWLAQYLAMLLPLVLYFSTRIKKVFWSLVYIIGFSCLWYAYSMSGLLGFGLGMVVLLIFLWKKKDLSAGVVKQLTVLGLVSVVIAVSQPGILGARLNDSFLDFKNMFSVVRKAYALEEETHIISDPGFIRSGLWRGTWYLITSSPKTFLIGTGPGTFPYTFQPFRSLELNYSSEWNFVFNKPHNFFLELWAESGLLGLTAYLVLNIWFVRKCLRNNLFYLIPGLIGFLVSGFFGWPVVATNLIWWVWLAVGDN